MPTCFKCGAEIVIDSSRPDPKTGKHYTLMDPRGMPHVCDTGKTKGAYCHKCHAFLLLRIAMKHVLENFNHQVTWFDAAKAEQAREMGVPIHNFRP